VQNFKSFISGKKHLTTRFNLIKSMIFAEIEGATNHNISIKGGKYMKKKLCIFGLLITLIIAAFVYHNYTSPQNPDANERAAEKLIKSKGYTVVTKKGELYRYTLDKEKLLLDTGNCWALQKINPEKYLGKEIIIYDFIVKNHPLSNYRDNVNKTVRIGVMTSEGKAIGGYSTPDIPDLLGGFYSLEGNTLEKVTGLSYSEQVAQWKRKYGN
jgi:hypothetical protein